MKSTLEVLITIIISVMIISCTGQNQQKPISTPLTPSFIEKIENPKYGFSSGIVDENGMLWFASNGGGIYRFDGKSFENYTQKDGLGSNQVYTVITDNHNTLWFGTQKGLSRFDRSNFQNIPLPYQDTATSWLKKVYPVINPNAVHSLIQDKSGVFWIGTGGGGAYRYDGKTFELILDKEGMKYEDSLYHNWIPDIKEDLNGELWFASMSYGGLSRYDGKVFKQYLRKDGLSDDVIRKIFVDRKGNLWLGFNGNRKSALTVYNGESFYTFPLEENSCHRNVRAIAEDSNGKIWLGGEEGICILSESNFSEFSGKNGETYGGINFILKDKEENMWFGGRNGLWKFDGKEVTPLTQ